MQTAAHDGAGAHQHSAAPSTELIALVANAPTLALRCWCAMMLLTCLRSHPSDLDALQLATTFIDRQLSRQELPATMSDQQQADACIDIADAFDMEDEDATLVFDIMSMPDADARRLAMSDLVRSTISGDADEVTITVHAIYRFIGWVNATNRTQH